MVKWLDETLDVDLITFDDLLSKYFNKKNEMTGNDVLDNQTIDKLKRLILKVTVEDGKIHLTYRELFNLILEVYYLPNKNEIVEIDLSTEVYNMVMEIYKLKTTKNPLNFNEEKRKSN